MPVKAYVIASSDCYWITPYLFELEAREVAELMTVVSGRPHWLTEIEIEHLSNALGEFNGFSLVFDIKNIKARDGGFEGEILIDGQQYVVQHKFPFEPWTVVVTKSSKSKSYATLENPV